jgi:hypothetical protein
MDTSNIGITFYLVRNKRYILDDLKKIDDESCKLVRKFNEKSTIYTDKYIYEFKNVDRIHVENLAIFIQRKNYEDKELQEWINSLPPKINDKGFSYEYSEENIEIDHGDFPTPEELLKRLKKKREQLEKLRTKK